MRVAVTITPDPAAESQKRRCGRPLRAGFARVERTAELPVDGGHEPEERLVENAHERADLIKWLQLLGPQLRGPPQTVDLLQQSPADLQLRCLRHPGGGEALELVAHPPECRCHRASTCFGRMRGKHRMHAKRGELLVEPAVAKLCAHGGEGGGERLGRTARAEIGFAQRSSAIALLGEVDEVKVAGKRAGYLLGAVQRPRGDERIGGVRIAAPCRGPGSRLDHRAAQRFDVGEQPRTAMLGDHLTECVADEPHLVAERPRHLLPRGLSHAAVGGLMLCRVCHLTQNHTDAPVLAAQAASPRIRTLAPVSSTHGGIPREPPGLGAHPP